MREIRNLKIWLVVSVFLFGMGLQARAGSIVAWGWNGDSQCNIPSPNSGFIAIAAGHSHSLGLKADGSIAAWGWNFYGQCNIPSPNSGFIAIAAGGAHSLGLKQDGSIVAWGWNNYGQCNIPSPNSGFIAVAAGGYHSLGLKQDGSIVAWGYNYYGQCNIPSPNSGFIAIAAGGAHSLGLKQIGSIFKIKTIVAWGDNSEGQCNIPSPNSGFIAIAACWVHSLGLKQDGSIVAWGNNEYGQCNIPSPNSGFIAIAAGGLHSLGLKQDGSIVAWGWNSSGQCNIPSPNSGFIAIAAGYGYSLALTATKPELGVVSKERIDRTNFIYDCNTTFTNLWPFAVKNVELQMMQAAENMTIIEPNVTFGDIQFNTRQSIASADTCTFRVDRSKAIEPEKIVWKVRCERSDTSMPIELTINGVGSGVLEGPAEGKIDFEDLEKLVGRWLWVGEAGSIPEDITGDGVVNLRDFAALAERWLGF